MTRRTLAVALAAAALLPVVAGAQTAKRPYALDDLAKFITSLKGSLRLLKHTCHQLAARSPSTSSLPSLFSCWRHLWDWT